MDAETEKYFMSELYAMQVRRHKDNIEFLRLVEEFANAIGKRPSEIIDEQEETMPWPAHLKLPKNNGNSNGNGRHRRGNKNKNARLN